jgi:hypothetical protein
MVGSIMETARELERRGVVFEQWPEQSGDGSSLLIASFRSPHGIGIDLWGLAEEESGLEAAEQLASSDPPSGDQLELQPAGIDLNASLVIPEENVDYPQDNNRSTEVVDDSGELTDIEYISEE